MRPLLLLALSVLFLGSASPRADELGQAQAQALQQQLRDWVAGLLGPAVTLPEPLPWHVSADHDHYVISWPIPGLQASSGEPAVTAKIRPLDGSRWSIDSLDIPSSGSFTMALDQPPMSTTFKIGHQDANGVIDPTFASSSKLHSELSDLTVKSEGDQRRQEQQLDHYSTDTTLTPREDGRLDVISEGVATGWNIASQMSHDKPVAVGIRAAHTKAQFNGVSRDRVASLLAAGGGLIVAFRDNASEPGLPPAARAQLRAAVESLQDMLSSIRFDETLDGVRLEIAGLGGLSVNRVRMDMGGESTDGRLRAWIDLALDQMASPSLPPKIAAYLPKHLEIEPTLSGVLITDLHTLALDATDAGMADSRFAPDLAAMFARGGIELGLDKLSFDLGAARVDGNGTITVTSPGAWRGKAHFAAVGFDELTEQARADPDLQSALPALILLRGLAQQDGQRLVWHVASDGTTTTVNGFDLSQLGGDKSNVRPPPTLGPGQQPSR